MKKTISTLLSAAMFCTLFFVPVSAESTEAKIYKDVPDDAWYYHVVYDARDMNLFTGSSETSFSPQQTMTRGMFVTVLGKMSSIDTAKYQTQKFKDVPKDVYYAPYINWALAEGLAAGTGDSMFSPNAPVTREQACIMLYRYAQASDGTLPDIDMRSLKFDDLNDLPEISKTAIRELYEATIVCGRSGGKFAPKAELTRAEGAQLFVQSCYVFRDSQQVIFEDDTLFFHVTFPGYWHGKATALSESSTFGQYSGPYSALHISNTYTQKELFTIITVKDDPKYSAMFFDKDDNLLPEYKLLDKVYLSTEKETRLVLLRVNKEAEDPADANAYTSYYRLQQGINKVIDSLAYDQSVKVVDES